MIFIILSISDGTDGKQARRTKTSGPLGELFDHGLDSWACFIMPITLYSVFGRGAYSIDVDRVFYIIVTLQITFTISHWEKYNTGTLFLPWCYDISQVVSYPDLLKMDIIVLTWSLVHLGHPRRREKHKNGVPVGKEAGMFMEKK